MRYEIKEQVDEMLTHGFKIDDLVKDLTFTQIVEYIKELNNEVRIKNNLLKEEILHTCIYQAKYGKLTEKEVNKYRL